MGNNTVRDILEVARCMVAGEVEYRRGNFDVAFEHLREAVHRDDALRYDEPWGWVQPVRHALGALLLEQKRYADAEAVYRADLERHPSNGWSLHGLAECLRMQGRVDEAAKTRAEFERAWQRSDIELKASCFCARGA
jgi:tetratricopeptide (TPR) repeat protein